MPLPSQISRPTGSASSFSNRGKPRNLKPIVVGVAAVALVAAAVWGISKIGGKGDSPLGPKSAGANQGPMVTPSGGQIAGLKQTPDAGNPPTVTQAPPPKPIDPGPVELRQGKPRGDSVTLKNIPNPAASNPPASSPKPTPPPAAATEPQRPVTPTPTNTVVPTPATPTPSMTPGLATDLQAIITDGLQKIGTGDPVGARAILSQAILDQRLPEQDRTELRSQVSKLNDDLVFSTRVAQGDPFTFTYSVQSGDSLVKINQKNALGPDWRLIKRINRMSDEHRLTLGQRLKLIRGPFHAVVTKSAFRLDLWMGPGDKPDQWVFVRSFTVGLGESGSTPVGSFIVKKGSKLTNPPWTNPRTGEHFAADDPRNPIGKFWIGLEGVGETATATGYGIHGTIDPDSIGQQKSMGCVRMGADDIALMYELMGEQLSTVKIQP